MKRQKRLLSILLALFIAFPSVPFQAFYWQVTAEAAAKKVEIVNVTTKTITIQKGESFQLKANLSGLTWKSSNKKIVTVSKTGKIKGIKNGNATVTASAQNTKTSIKVIVGTKVSSVNVVKSAIALGAGTQSTIKAEVLPTDASNKTLNYQSSNKNVASVSATGIVTAKKVGTANITVSATDGTGKKETVIVTVRAADSSVRLQDDYYDAINATILNEHVLKEDEYQWSRFDDLQENITANLNGMIDSFVEKKDSYAKGSLEQKIVDFYMMYRDMDKRNKAGIEPLKPYIDKIDSAKTVPEFVDVLAELAKARQNSVFTFQVTIDAMDSNKFVLNDNGPQYMYRKDYLIGDENKKTQEAILACMKQMFVLAGESEDKALEISGQVFNLMQELSALGLSVEESRDPTKNYHEYTKAELIKLYSNCDIEKFLKDIGVTNFERCIVSEEEAVKKMNSYLTQDNLELLKNYAKSTLYWNLSEYLTDAHYKALQDLSLEMAGIKDSRDSDQIAREAVQSFFSWDFGKLYVEKYFSEESKKEIESMVDELLKTFRNRIQRIDWISDATKERALKKLDTMKVKIGYPDNWIENIMNIKRADNATIQEVLDSPYDKRLWVTQPQTVNAFYNPLANDITFPAGILQKPFYDKNADYAQNLGAIGTVIGHEITHAFDTRGALYDENGNYSNWWTQEDMEQFMARAQKVVNYYNSIEVANGIFQNGDMTIGENIADMGAMACVLEIVGNDKKAQLEVFKSNAAIWASTQTDQYRNNTLLISDTHSLNKVRVNAVLPLFEQFYDVFGVTKYDAMYVAPEDRVSIW